MCFIQLLRELKLDKLPSTPFSPVHIRIMVSVDFSDYTKLAWC